MVNPYIFYFQFLKGLHYDLFLEIKLPTLKIPSCNKLPASSDSSERGIVCLLQLGGKLRDHWEQTVFIVNFTREKPDMTVCCFAFGALSMLLHWVTNDSPRPKKKSKSNIHWLVILPVPVWQMECLRESPKVILSFFFFLVPIWFWEGHQDLRCYDVSASHPSRLLPKPICFK